MPDVRYQRALLDNFPFMVWLKDAESRFLAVNRPFAEAAGFASAVALVGKQDGDVWPADLASRYRADDAEVMQTRQKKIVQELVAFQGERHWVETYKAPVLADDGTVFGTVGFARDISAMKAAEEAILLRDAAFAGMLRGEPLVTVLDLMVLAIEAEMPGWRGLVLLPGADGDATVIGPSLTTLGDAAQGAVLRGRLAPLLAAFAETTSPVVVNPNETEGGRTGGADDPLGVFQVLWGVVLRDARGATLAHWLALGEAADGPSPAVLSRLNEGAQVLTLLLRHHQVAADLQAGLVTFRGIIDSMGDALFVQRPDGTFVDVNASAARLSGISAEALIGKRPQDLAAPGLNDLAAVDAAIAVTLAGTPSEFEFWLQRPDERIFPTRVRLVRGLYFGQPVVIAVVVDISQQRLAEFRMRVEHALNRGLTQDLGSEALIDVMLEIGLEFPEFDGGCVHLPSATGGLRLVRAAGLSNDLTARWDGMAADTPWVNAVQRGEVSCHCSPSCRHCDSTDGLGPAVVERAGLGCLVLVPIRVEGQLAACLALVGQSVKRVSLFTRDALKQLADILGQAMARQQQVSERQAALVRQRLAASVFDNAHEGIMITDARGRIVEVNATFTELTGFPRDEAVGQSADLLKSGHHDAAFYADMWQAIRVQGFWRGEIWNRKKGGEIFVEQMTISAVRDDAGEILNYVGIFSDITLLKEHQQRLERLAHFDALTQLPNRMLLHDRMSLAMAHVARHGKHLVLAYLDLDGFKPINDTHGHAAGDRLLVEVAQRLKQCVRAGDTVARLGGDEFVLLFVDVDDVHEADRAINRVLSAISSPFAVQGMPMQLSASIGVTIYPDDAVDADTLLRHADQAMYLAKQSGRNQSCQFDPESDRRTRNRRDEVARMRQGLAAGEFLLYYQPKVNMREGRVLGAEALIRWQHPERGLLTPADFLPALEGSDFCLEVGDWVLSTALAQLMAWQRAGVDVTVSVNISAEHLLAPSFLARLRELLAGYPDLAPGRLEIEVLETAAIEDLEAVSSLFRACAEFGIRFALDDFGTGYSSLTYFRHLPAEVMKIDQSFVADMLENPDDLAIVEGVIGLAEAFHRHVVAEGVETVEHGMVLMQLGCDVAQGYGIARPMPPEQLPAWVSAFEPDPLWGSIAAFNWPRDDLPLLIAEADHRNWMRQLFDYLDDKPASAPPVAMAATSCRFGRWYFGPAGERYGHLEPFMAIEAIHEEVHRLGSRLLDCPKADPARSTPLREAILAESLRLGECLEQIQAEVLFVNQTKRR